ncbi:autotransporter domain-containing protein [Chelativorans xinjiangense]|uniref:autotransporter domain-containing protein n=1 Tax=Chelativorans xinjiangense TaxID=2681485 RepID=UPI00135B0C80|nr:autotransporter serine protease [Chelativorans xinjiangense]
MRVNFRTIKFLAATTALFAPHVALSQEAHTPVPPAADAEYSRNWGMPMINALPAYLQGYTGKGVTVAVIDTGLDVNHPEFAGRISEALRNFGTEKERAPDDVSHTDDEDGKINGHGTHVAGIVGAARDGKGMHGVAYEATILPLRAIGTETDDDALSPDMAAVEYAARHKVDVFNASYGPDLPREENNPHYQKLEYIPVMDGPDFVTRQYNALRKAADADVVMVVAAGNDFIDQPKAAVLPSGGFGMFPLITPENTANRLYEFVKPHDDFDYQNPDTWDLYDPSHPDVADLDFSDLQGSVIAVVAVGKDGNIASYSQRCGAAAEWCMAAPGGEWPEPDPSVAIYSTWPMSDGSYKAIDGTSMAAPHVTGAAAVVRSAFPYMNASQTIETILTTATKEGYEDESIYGQGLLNLGDAVNGPMEFRYQGVFDVDTQGYSSIWSNPISGPADLTKRGEGALILSGDNSTYTGPTTVLGGTLAVDGSIVSQVDVSGAGLVAGIGTVGSLTAGEGGAIAPGSVLDPAQVVSALSVDGDFVQQAGSTYQAGLASTSDLIDTTGSAAIDDGAHIELLRQGTPSVDTRYTLLTAAGGVNGTYAGLTGIWAADTPFVDFALAYDPQNVFLDTERTATTFADVGMTFNQRSAAAASEALGAGNPVHDNILFLTTPETRNAFDQLSGDIYSSVHGALIQDSHFVRDAASDRIRAAFEGVGASPMQVMAYGPAGPELAPATNEKFTVWGSGFGAWGHLDGDGNAARLDRSTGGLLAGGDILVGDHWRLGLLAGYSHTSFDVDNRASSGSSNNYHLGLYAGTQRGPLGFRSGLAYSWHRVETDRVVAFPGFSDGLSADYDAGTFQAFGELGYRLDTASVSFEPYANLSYVGFDADGFSEDGGAAALSSGDQSSDTTFTTLGLRASSAFTLGSTTATARGGIGWRHAFGDVTPETHLAFAGGSSFAIKGTPIAKNAAVLEAGLDINLSEKATVGLTYQGQLASDAQEHGFNGKLTVRF